MGSLISGRLSEPTGSLILRARIQAGWLHAQSQSDHAVAAESGGARRYPVIADAPPNERSVQPHWYSTAKHADHADGLPVPSLPDTGECLVHQCFEVLHPVRNPGNL